MRCGNRHAVWLVALAVLAGAPALAQPIPRQLNVQGVLRNAVGEVVSGNYNLTFRLYDAASGGTKLWEQSAAVTITGGVFNVYLGPMPQNLFAATSQAWLEIQVGTDPPLPRRPLTSVGYAFMAERAAECETLLSAATDLDCVGCVSATELDPGLKWALGKTPGGDAVGLDCVNCVSSVEIVDGQVTSADIGDGEVQSQDLAPNLTLSGNTTASNLLVTGSLYTGASMTASTLRLTNTGNLQNIGTLSMSGQLTNTVATGTAPFVVSSTTRVANLNADLLDGQHGSYYQNASNLNAGTVPVARLPLATTTTAGVVRVGSGLAVDGTGVLSNAGVLSVSAVSPLQSTGGQSPVLSIPKADASTDGYLAKGDWSTFNNKLAAVTTRAGDPFVGAGTAASPLGMTQAGASSAGWLSAADWNTFNNKAPGSGSNSYIQNQSAADQAASFRISGTGQIGSTLSVGSTVTATAFLDADGTYYVDPANTGTAGLFAGNVGIGTSTAGARLDVAGGNIRTTGQFISTAASGAPLQVSSSVLVTNLNADLLDGQHASAFAPASGSGQYVQNQSAAAQAASFWVSGTGQVGGNFTAGALCLAGDCKTQWSQVTGPWTVSGTNIYNNNSGNVGIKNTSPTAPLTVGAMYAQNSILGTLGAYDTRSTNPNPETYGMGVTLEFKGNGANGLSDGGSYNAVLSYRQWSSGTDWSGGGVHQLGFTQNGNLWHRYSQTTGSWGAWRQVAENGMTNNFAFLGRVGVGTSAAPKTAVQIGDPNASVASGWPATASQGVLVGQDTDNLFVGLIDEGGNADRAAIVFGDDSDDYLRILFNNSSAVMTELVRILPDGRVGIGTTTPAQKLDVNGYVRAATGLCIGNDCRTDWTAVGTNYWSLTGTSLTPTSATYNVGIGTNAADQKLVVVGAGSTFKVYGSATGDLYSTGPLRPHFGGSDFNVYSGIPGSGTLRLGVASDGTTLIAPNGGNVGIGSTSAPSQRLHVRGGHVQVDGGDLILADTQGATPFRIKSYNSATSLWIYPSSGTYSEVDLATSHNWDTSLSLRYTPGAVGAGAGLLQIGQLSKNSGTFTHGATAFYTNGLERMRIVQDGKVGIGLTGPAATLDVATSAGGVDGVRVTSEGHSAGIGVDRSGTYWGTGLFQDGTRRLTIDSNGGVLIGGSYQNSNAPQNGLAVEGYVGVGTATPGYPLTVLRNVTGDVQLQLTTGAQSVFAGANWLGGLPGIGTNSAVGLSLVTNNTQRLTIDANGNVGVNTTSPGYRLDVNGTTSTGDLRITGSAFTDQMNRIVPFYLRGTGLNNSATRRVVLGNSVLVDNSLRGLTLTIIRRSDMAHVSSTNYDTYGDPNASNALATALQNLSRDNIYILTSFDAWEANVTASLQAQFERLGLFKARATSPGLRRPYAAVFEGGNSGQATARVIEVEHSDNANAPYAEIAGWFANGTIVTGAQPNALTNPIGTAAAVIVNESNNVGIGTTTPARRLHVAGDVQVDGQICTPSGCGSGLNYWALSGSDLYPTSTAYNLAVGTTTAGSDKLRVAGAIRTTAGGAYGAGGLYFGYHSLNSNSNNWLYLGDQNGSVYGGRGLAAGYLWSESSAYLAVSGGNVGVGTSSPTHKLQLHGNLALTTSYPNIPASYARGTRSLIMASSQNADGTGWAYGSRIAVVDYGDGLGTSFDTLYAGGWTNDALVISGRSGRNGYVGVGTTAPNDRLDVAGTLRILTGSNPIRFTAGWTGFPDSTTNQAEISNDTGSYKTLMIVGNKSNDGATRRVSIWDRLEVNGNQLTTGSLQVNGNVSIGGSFSSSVAPATAAVMKVTGGQIAIQQQTSEGNTRIFADFPPYHSWGIYHDNPNNDLLFTRRDGLGFQQFSEAGPGGTTTTTEVASISLDEGNARFYGTVNARAGLCINSDCKASWQDVVQGVTGSHVRGVVPIFGFDEGAVRVTSTGNYQIVTKTLYTSLEGLFNLPTYPGTVREYYLGIRKADNIDSCGGGTDWRFWFTWAAKNGHGFQLSRDWGSPEEGSVQWVKVPTIASQIAAAGGGTAYWRLEAKIPSTCFGKWMKVYGISVMAVDRTGGSEPAVALASDGAGSAAETDLGGGRNIAVDQATGNVGINVFPDSGVKLDVNGLIRSRSGGIQFPDGTTQTTAATTTPNYWTQTGLLLYPNNTWWNVGVGNTAPAVKLHVTGNAFFDTSGSGAVERAVTIKQTGTDQILYGAYPWEWSPSLQLQSVGANRFLWMNAGADAGSYNARIRAGATGLDFYVGGSAGDNGTHALTLASNGRVGVNTTAPGAALEVNGDISLPSSSGNKQIYTWSPTDGNWRIGMSASPGFNRAIATSHVEYLTYSTGAGQGFAVGVNGGNSSFEVRGDNHQAYFRGNVGIQHTAPATALHVGGAIAATDWIGAGCEGACEVSGGYSLMYPNGFGVFTKSMSIGTHADYGQGNLYVTNRINTPEIAFRNADGGDDSDPYRLRKVRSASNTNWLELQLNDDSNEEFRIYGYSCAGYGCGEYSGNLYHFFRADGTAYHAGNLGLGTTGPGYRLDVNGDMRATGSVYLTDGNTRLVRGNGNALRVQTNSGYVDIGPQNTGWAHFITDRGSFYFNPKVTVDGNVEPYTDNTSTLGTASLRWANGYFTSLTLGGVTRSSWPSGIGGGGTAGYLARWTSATDIGNSVLYDNGTNVGIGTTSPGAKLDVVGSVYVRTAAGSNNLLSLSGGDANIGLELRSGSSGGTPYIDFANDASVDYDARLRLVANGRLMFEGTSVGIGRDPGEALDVQGNTRSYGVIYSQSDPSYAQTYLRTWGLAGNGTIYIESAGGQTLWLTDSWSTTGTLGIQFGRTSWRNASNAETAWVDRDGNASFGGTLSAGNLNISGEIVQVEDGRISYGGSWNSGGACWGVNRFSYNCRYTPPDGDADASGYTITLSLDGNQYRSVLMSHLDWSNTRFFDVYLSFDGGGSYTFHKRIYTYRATTQTPYTSTIYAIAENLPIGANVRVRIQGRKGRIHFEGFSLLKYNVGDTEPNREHLIGTIYYDADNLGYYVDPNGTSRMNEVQADRVYGFADIRSPIFYDYNDTGYYADPNGGSRMNLITFNKLVPTTGNSPNGGYDHYAIYEEPGTWTYPYPDLMIEYHTGIKYIAYYGYGGHRFYTGYNPDASPNTLAFSVGEFDHATRAYYGLYTPAVYDMNGSSCQVDPSDWTRVQYLTASYDIIAQRAVRAGHGVFSEISVAGGISIGGHSIAAVGDDYGYVGWNGRRFKAMWAYGFNSGSSEALKKDIQDLSEAEHRWALERLRQVRTVFYRYKSESADPVATNHPEGAEPDIVFRGTPHIGVIAETLPPNLTEWNGKFSGGYNLSDMDGLLVAAVRALDNEVQALRDSNAELQDRVSLLEQTLVDAGLLK